MTTTPLNNTFKILIGVSQNYTGEPIFTPFSETAVETQSKIDEFKSTNKISFNDISPDIDADGKVSFLPAISVEFENDVMIVRTGEIDSDTSYYILERNSEDFEVVKFLEYNYNMTEFAVDATLDRILGNITRELAPPKKSKTFTYDFKFARNRNRSVTTGSASPVRTRTTSRTSGGGY